MHRILLFSLLVIFVNATFAFGGKSLPSPKSLPKTKSLPASKALPVTKSLPVYKSLPKVKKIPSSKPLPKAKKLILKPVFEPEINLSEYSGDSGPTFSQKKKIKPKPDPRFDQPEEVIKMEKNKIQWEEGVLNLTVDGVSSGDIRIFTTNKFDPLFLRKATLINQLENKIMPEIVKQISLYFRNKKWIDKRELLAMGFEVTVNTNELIVDINTPAIYRKIKTQQLGGNVLQARAIDVRPSRRSASITPYWSRTWRDLISTNNFVDFDAAINFDGWVLESDTSYNLINSRNRRKTTRLVRDYPAQVTRLTVGDVEYKTIGLMGRKALGGMSIGREFSLSPNLLTTPISHQKIFLKNDATIRILVNDIPRQTFSLRAGYYDLQDFPLIDGLNFVKIEITDIFGQVTTREFLGFDNKKILVPGITDYSITAGFERLFDNVRSTKYDFKVPTYSGYIRHGVHKNITLGALSEGDINFLSVGGYAAMTHILGTLETSGLYSKNVDGSNESGYGASVNYYFATQRFNFNNIAYYKSLNYAYLGRNKFSVAQKYFYSATVGMPVPFLKTWRHSYNGRYEKRWNGSEEARGTAKLSGRLSKNFTISAEGFYAFTDNRNNSDQGISLSIRWYPQKRISVAAIGESQNNGQQLDIARGPDGEQGVSTNLSLANNDLRRRVNGGIRWKSQLFDTRYNLNINQDKLSGEKLLQNDRRFESFSLSSSFAYVDGAFAMGAPIRNGSFVIFKSGKGLGEGRIAIAKSGDEDDRDAMPFLNGSGSVSLFTNLNQYGTSTAYLLPYLEDGFVGLEQRKYRIFSGYRSGSLINVTQEVRLYGSGVLADREWQSIELVKGTFIHEETGEKTRFFTDDEGYFEVENLQLGKYLIVLDNRRGSGEVFVKPERNIRIKESSYDFGIVNLEGVN